MALVPAPLAKNQKRVEKNEAVIRQGPVNNGIARRASLEPEREMRSLGRRHRALAALLVLAVALGRADAELVAHSPTTSFPNRYARNICSLAASTAEEMSACQVESLYGTQDGRVNMTFGEESCSVTLKNCVPGVCYSFRDATAAAPRDDVPRPTGGPSASFFVSVQATAGASVFAHTNAGFSFKASAAEVTLTYQTRTCADHFSYRGRTGEQECRQSFAAITEIDAGTPWSLTC